MSKWNTLFSSQKDEWSTPQALFDEWNKKYNFTLDVCASKENAKCVNYFTKEQNGLLQEWTGVCWMNPPYGRDIYKWIQKAYESIQKIGGGCDTVVCLLPARTDTKWFHDFAIKGELHFVKGRVKFSGSKNSAPFPSVIVVFTRNIAEQ